MARFRLRHRWTLLRIRVGGWRYRAGLWSRQAAWRLRRLFLDRREDELFDGLGWYIGPPFPGDCIADLTAPGSADQAAEFWLQEMDFRTPRKLAVAWLREFGCWDDDELAAMGGRDIDLRVLWLACGDIRDDEQYEGGDSDLWQGLIH